MDKDLQDNEFDELFRSKLSGDEANVPEALWARIESGASPTGSSTIVAKLSTGKLVALAATVLMVITSLVYFFNTNDLTDKESNPVIAEEQDHKNSDKFEYTTLNSEISLKDSTENENTNTERTQEQSVSEESIKTKKDLEKSRTNDKKMAPSIVKEEADIRRRASTHFGAEIKLVNTDDVPELEKKEKANDSKITPSKGSNDDNLNTVGKPLELIKNRPENALNDNSASLETYQLPVVKKTSLTTSNKTTTNDSEVINSNSDNSSFSGTELSPIFALFSIISSCLPL